MKNSTFETKGCLMIWFIAVLYSVYCFMVESNIFFSYFIDVYGDLEYDWPFIDRPKDVADFEWMTFIYLFRKVCIWIIVQITVTEVMLYFHFTKAPQYLRILISVMFLTMELGVLPLLFIILQPLIFVAAGLAKNVKIIWFTNALCLFFISYFKEFCKNQGFIGFLKINEKQAYLAVVANFWMNLRCAGYALDRTCERERNINVDRFVNFFEYCLYLPTLFTGPFISYGNFQKYYRSSNFSLVRVTDLFLSLGKCIFWIFFLEYCLHYIYVNAAAFQIELVENLSLWALCGYGYAMGQAFHIKYVVVYGFSTTISSFEGVTVPELPKCIGRIHLYSDMWKYFDTGLHTFLVRYIYIPSMKVKSYTNKLFSSFLCFSFVYIWHGLQSNIFVWTLLNFFGISIETLSALFYEKYMKSFCVRNLGVTWTRRLTCLLASPLLAMSAVSNFYFFAGSSVGNIFVDRLLNAQIYNNIIIILGLYCCCQVSTELRESAPHRKTTFVGTTQKRK